jgi:hypothetical protein
MTVVGLVSFLGEQTFFVEAESSTERFLYFCVREAVSSPSVSKRVHVLRVPQILSFIGKNFGTGVILSTAFAHLLQDAFEALHNPAVKERSGAGGKAGLIM